jgi:hypothetical protein
MKRIITLLLSIMAVFLFLGCGKDRGIARSSNEKLIAQAKDYFEATVQSQAKNAAMGNPRKTSSRSIDWSRATVIKVMNSQAVLAPIHFEKTLYWSSPLIPGAQLRLDSLSQLMVFKDSLNQFHVQVITALPDSLSLKGSGAHFSGLAWIDAWDGTSIVQYKYNPDGTAYVFNPGAHAETTTAHGQTNGPVNDKITPTALTVVCYEVDGYNYSSGDPDGGVYWSESAGCEYQYDPVASLPPLAGLSPTGYNTILAQGNPRYAAARLIVTGADNIIADIQQYFKCFTSSGSIDHSYTVTVCVDEPSPGTREPWGVTNGGPIGSSATGNPVNSGHTFLILTENNAGNITTRNVGFYPSGLVTPLNSSSQGVLNDDERHPYSISITWQVNNQQFFNILNYVSVGNNPGYIYDLSENNCTTFAIHAMAAGGIYTPNTTGTWPLGKGNDPGDYGADFRKMPLSTTMTRSTYPTSHPDAGICLHVRKTETQRLSLTFNNSLHETLSPITGSPIFSGTTFTGAKRDRAALSKSKYGLVEDKPLESI